MTYKPMAQAYQPWMLDAALNWIRDGWSLGSFPGKHNVSSKVWSDLLRHQPELRVVKDEYEKLKFDKRLARL